jgi:hypothetical protein
VITTANMQPAEAHLPARAAGDAVAVHARFLELHTREEERRERIANRYSLVRLVAFLTGAALLTAGVMARSALELGSGAALLLAFFGAVLLHARTISAQTAARIRRQVHERYLKRLSFACSDFSNQGTGLLPRAHPYALDIDLLGRASLFQRLDVTHTRDGARTLAAWLGYPATVETIALRQAAVRELAGDVQLRQELEAAAGEDPAQMLDASGLEALIRLPSLFDTSPSLRALALLLPPTTLLVYALGALNYLPHALWLLPCTAQVALLIRFSAPIRHALDLVTAKAPVFAAFQQMLLLVEQSRWQSALLNTLQQRIAFGAVPASAHLRRLARWAGFAELRQSGIFHVFINALTLWDLHVLWGVERFVRDVGSRSREWFVVLGELEALASLATLAHGDPDTSFPDFGAPGSPFTAEALGHPLLAPSVRVLNDVALTGPGMALVVTGSNMAGKSTLLRAVGQNIALALAGGPVVARRMRLSRVRLRASMRADDSLEAGSSYFHAELEKLKGVVAEVDAQPPVFFLLDELLRGTNARARHIGAKAVLMHLLDRHATGLCATHDVELAALEHEHPGRIGNVHFTDVVVDGEMRFDYKLRQGIVRTSNALRLLRMAGIEVPEAEREALENASAGERFMAPGDPPAATSSTAKEAH